MSKIGICTASTVEMAELNNLFIELTSKCCNQHCRNCYIDFPKYKKVEDFINTEIIKTALNDTVNDNIECIYLTGAEPMLHPDFNAILRLCLKRSNVCICTNGSLINEKKSRFLKKVESESSNEIFFKISIDHYNEITNDELRYRGAFRHGIFAIKSLYKYNFKPIVVVTNYSNESDQSLYEGFYKVFKNAGLNIDLPHIQINPVYNKTEELIAPDFKENSKKLDCKNGRILTSNGIYSCPFLANDYRGRCGGNFQDYTKKCSLETNFCSTCQKANSYMFSIDYSKFQ